MIKIDLGKAKQIHATQLRKKRAPMLAELDVQYQRAHEDGRDASEIVAKKQQLRDITKQVDAASSLDDLRNITLD